MAILLGLLSAICWGTTDFIAGSVSRKHGVSRTLFYSQLFGLFFITLSLLYFSEFNFNFTLSSLFICILASICNLLGMSFLLKALSIGKASIVAPIASLYGAVTTILSLLAGNPLHLITLTGLFICVIGACLTSVPKNADGKKESFISIFYALLSSLMFGLGFWLQGEFAVNTLGVINALWIYYFTAVILLFFFLIATKNFKAVPANALITILAISIFSLFGFFSLAYGSRLGHVAIVTVLSSLASGVTAFWGFLILHERLSHIQILGVILIIGGVILLKV